MGLPAELRVEIFKHHLASLENCSFPTIPPLAQVSWQVRKEVLPPFYQAMTFKLSLCYDTSIKRGPRPVVCAHYITRFFAEVPLEADGDRAGAASSGNEEAGLQKRMLPRQSIRQIQNLRVHCHLIDRTFGPSSWEFTLRSGDHATGLEDVTYGQPRPDGSALRTRFAAKLQGFLDDLESREGLGLELEKGDLHRIASIFDHDA